MCYNKAIINQNAERKRGDFMKSQGWLFLISFLIFALTVLSFETKLHSQLKRTEEGAKELEQYNPGTAVKEGTKKVLDNTVHQVLPFEIPTDSKLTKEEQLCYSNCKSRRDEALKASKDKGERGGAWTDYRSCVDQCPEKAASRTDGNRGVFDEAGRVPAGSTIPSR